MGSVRTMGRQPEHPAGLRSGRGAELGWKGWRIRDPWSRPLPRRRGLRLDWRAPIGHAPHVERYRVARRQPLVAAITNALEESGARLVRVPDPNIAPFEYRIAMPDGEELDLVCYAFLANKYRQRGRPSDEHRFQIKYGSDFHRYHRLFIDRSRRKVTLFFGAHLEEGIFVAADPEAHNPTWFSKSIEFKDEHVDRVKRHGWFGWERERIPGGRRKQPMPLLSYQTEALVGLTPVSFLHYVRFERFATGLDATERLAAAQSFRPSRRPKKNDLEHALERAFGLPKQDILDMVQNTPWLLKSARGGVAEVHLERYLRRVAGLSEIDQSDSNAPPDFHVTYRGEVYGIECKNTRRGTKRPRVDFQRTRAAKANPCRRYYLRKKFDVLAACVEPHTHKWEFRFCPTRALPEHGDCPGRISPNIYLDVGAAWTPDVLDAIKDARKKSRR